MIVVSQHPPMLLTMMRFSLHSQTVNEIASVHRIDKLHCIQLYIQYDIFNCSSLEFHTAINTRLWQGIEMMLTCSQNASSFAIKIYQLSILLFTTPDFESLSTKTTSIMVKNYAEHYICIYCDKTIIGSKEDYTNHRVNNCMIQPKKTQSKTVRFTEPSNGSQSKGSGSTSNGGTSSSRRWNSSVVSMFVRTKIVSSTGMLWWAPNLA